MQRVEVHTIVAAVDFSDWTEPVLHTAAELAARYTARLVAVFAEQFLPPPYFTQRALPQLVEVLEAQRQAAQQHLAERVAAAVGDGVAAEPLLVEAAPVEGILRAVESTQAGLVVMGTHGRSGLNRLLLGSVAEKVVRLASVPVLTVRGAAPRAHGAHVPLRRILCPYNHTPVAQDALRYAADLAQRSGAELVLATSVEDASAEDEEQREHDRLCAEVARGVQEHCALRSVVRRGPADEQLLQLVAEEQPDLLVVGVQHRRLLEASVIGTTSVRLLRHAPCPVLTVSRR